MEDETKPTIGTLIALFYFLLAMLCGWMFVALVDFAMEILQWMEAV